MDESHTFHTKETATFIFDPEKSPSNEDEENDSEIHFSYTFRTPEEKLARIKYLKILRLLIINVIIIFIEFKYRNNLVTIKMNYLSDKNLFYFNISYEKKQITLLIYIFFLTCFSFSTGVRFLFLQSTSNIICIIVSLIIKNILQFRKKLYLKHIFYSSEIIISFIFINRKILKKLGIKNIFLNMLINIIDFMTCAYFILVEITNDSENELTAINQSIYGFLIAISIYYIFKKVFLKKTKFNSFLFFVSKNLKISFTIYLIILLSLFFITKFFENVYLFFISGVLLKLFSVLIYMLFELIVFFRNNYGNFFRYNLNKLHDTEFLYFNTTNTKKFYRGLIALLVEYSLFSRLEKNFTNNEGFIIKHVLNVIFNNFLHGILIIILVKYIFSLIMLNNNEIFNMAEVDIKILDKNAKLLYG